MPGTRENFREFRVSFDGRQGTHPVRASPPDQNAGLAVLKAAPDGHPPGVTRVLIAADDSEASLDAARAAHRLFGDDADYWIIHVGLATTAPGLMWGSPYPVTMPVTGYPLPMSVVDGPRMVAEAERQASATIREAAMDAEPVGAVGDPATAIIDSAHSHHVDVIVVGSHERSWFSRLFRAAVSGDVIRESDIPVLVIK